MKKKTLAEMNGFQRVRNSLAGKTFRVLIKFSLVVSIAAISFGYYLYYSSVLRDYRNQAWQMSRTANQFMDKDEALDEAAMVMYYYDTMTEEERAQLHDKHSPLLSRFDGVRGEGFDRLCAMLRQIQENNGGIAAFTAFLDLETNRRVFVTDSDPKSSFCPPGSWDVLEEDAIRDLTEGKKYFLDELFGVGKIPATIINMEPYGYRCMAGTILGAVDGKGVYVFFDMDMRDAMRTVRMFLWIYIGMLAVLTSAALFVAIFYINRKTVRPINQLAAAAKAYTLDRNDEQRTEQYFSKLDIRTGDEIESLSHTMQEMEEDLGQYVQNLTHITAERERISTELSLATRIQADMLPNTFPAYPDRTEFDIYATMEPARGVGGDFYDFFLIDRDHLCMVMADVSGKGIPAALFMMAAKIMLKNYAMVGKSPAEILTDTNTSICANNREEMFVTVWLGILDIKTGIITAANAGHEYPVFMQDGSFALMKDKHGFVIGGMDGVKYKEYEVALKPGDKLFLYTDGVPEATDPDGEQFGLERTLEVLNQDRQASPEKILGNVRAALDGFVKEEMQFDDVTMLCMEYRGPGH